MRSLFFAVLFLASSFASAQQYDLVIEGGRVMDPETALDAVRNVGISDGKIVHISEKPLSGRRVIHAAGLVVAPGFIDLHQHGQELASQRVKAFDGVTTALEMEIGAPDVASFLKWKEGHSIIHYGTTASHAAARALVFGSPIPPETFAPDAAVTEVLPKVGPATEDHATPEQIQKIEDRLRGEIDAGALGIGMGIQYTPGATRLEVIDMFRLAAERKLPVYTHMRSFGRIEPGSAIEATEEVIGAAAISGAPLHIVHINSTCLRDAPECISLVAGARARGLDVTTEAYPYIAGMTAINSAVFNPGWRERQGIDYSNLVLPGTGEHLTKERFEELHNSSKSQPVLIFSNTQEVVDSVIINPLVMIATDGAPGHPRNAGTYSRILASLRPRKENADPDGSPPQDDPDARANAGAVNARREAQRPPPGRRGRRHRSLRSANDFRPIHLRKANGAECGCPRAAVEGTVLIDEGKMLPDVFPGRAIVGPGKMAH